MNARSCSSNCNRKVKEREFNPIAERGIAQVHNSITYLCFLLYALDNKEP